MSVNPEDLMPAIEKNMAQGSQLLEKLLSAAQPGAVYSEPVTAGAYTVITASEVAAGGGFGSGLGFGTQQQSADQTGQAGGPQGGAGGGMGGGGGSSGRPVAAIVIGPDGVRVRPVMDVTKLALAGITAWGGMLLMFGRMRRFGRRR